MAQVLDILGINASCKLGEDLQVIFKSCVNMVLDTCLKAVSYWITKWHFKLMLEIINNQII